MAIKKKAAKALKEALDMSTAARMKRAQKMGFDADKVWYHGTGKNYGNHGEIMGGDFGSFDPTLSGKSSKTGAPEGSFFFTDDPSVASGYTVKWKGDFSEEYKDAANVIPARIKKGKTLTVNAKNQNWRDVSYRGQDYDVNELAEYAKQRGYQGLEIKNVLDHGVGGGSGPSTTLVSFDPSNIRSVHAAFDPSKAGSSDLMAGMGGLLGATALSTAAADNLQDNVSLLGIPGESLVKAGEWLDLHDDPVKTLLGTSNPVTQGASWLVDDYMGGLSNWLKQTGKGEKKTLLDRMLVSNPALIGL